VRWVSHEAAADPAIARHRVDDGSFLPRGRRLGLCRARVVLQQRRNLPYNQHLLHDAGAFQIGLGAILVLGAVRQEVLRWAFVAVLVASLLHLISHIEDRGLGGHATDLPALALLCVVLAAGMFISPGVVRKEAEG